MSKAFTKEDDGEPPERPGRMRRASGLPPGAVNYMTAKGAERLRKDLDELVERSRLEGAVEPTDSTVSRDDSTAERILELRRRLDSATVVPVPDPVPDTVLFGATVTVRDQGGAQVQYRIVGADETELGPGWISWLSPLAKALLGTRIGQHLRLEVDSRAQEFHVMAIDF